MYPFIFLFVYLNKFQGKKLLEDSFHKREGEWQTFKILERLDRKS